MALIENPLVGVTTFHIAPPQELKARLASTNTKVLERDYLLGKKLGKKFIMDWQNSANQPV